MEVLYHIMITEKKQLKKQSDGFKKNVALAPRQVL